MKVFVKFSVCILMTILSINVYSLGDLAHNYVAKEVSAGEKDVTLKNILDTYDDAYLVGSDYPDTGYISGFNYGEDSHWPFFINPFSDYIKQKCQPPLSNDLKVHCDQLTAFLLGIATHVKSDIISHWTYYNFVAAHDFGELNTDNWNKAHDAMDPASDFYVIVRKGIYDHPLVWWVPVEDLVNIYDDMKKNNVIKDTVTADEIIKANAIYYVALGLTEDLIAYPAYTYDAIYHIPWGIAHLEDEDPQYGAFPTMINESRKYVEEVWAATQGNANPSIKITPKKITGDEKMILITTFVQKAVHDSLITITPFQDSFGDITLTPNSLQFTSPSAKATFELRLNALREKLTDEKTVKNKD